MKESDGSKEEWRRALEDMFGSIDMDEIMKSMQEQMKYMLEAMAAGEVDMGQLAPYISGFSMRVGADGRPHIERFGTTGKPTDNVQERGSLGPESREPLTDMIETDGQVCITVEVPGVEKTDINLEVADDTLVINVDTDSRRYFKEIVLPCPVDENSARATYNNGVLDITLDRTSRERKGTRIAVE